MEDVVDLLDGEVCKTHQVAGRRHDCCWCCDRDRDRDRQKLNARLKIKFCVCLLVFPVNKWVLSILKSRASSDTRMK